MNYLKLLALFCLANLAYGKSLLIKNVNLIDVKTGKVSSGSSIFIKDQKIAEVAQGSLKVKADQTLDGKGKYVIPGLIDSHVHLGEIPGFRGDHIKKYPKVYKEAISQIPKSYLYYGFTTLIDLNVVDRQFINDFKGMKFSPDVFDCDNALALANGYPMSFTPKKIRFKMYPNFLYDKRQTKDIPSEYKESDHTPEANVKRAIRNGAICIKSHYEKGFIKGAKPLPTMTPEMMKAIRKEADRNNVPFIVHANSFEAQKFSVKNGVSILGHGMWHWNPHKDEKSKIPSEVKKLLDDVIKKKIGYMPTVRVLYGSQALFDPSYLTRKDLKAVVPTSLINWYNSKDGKWFENIMKKNTGQKKGKKAMALFEPGADRTRRVLSYLSKNNANLLLGSDTPAEPTYGNFPGLNGYLELLEWDKARVPLIKILRAATIDNAEAFNIENKYGSISKGKIAHLLLLDKNPLQTVTAYNSISIIILKGKVVNRTVLRAK